MIKIFDTHAHYDDEAFDTDRETLLKGMKDKGVCAITNIGVTLETSQYTAKLTEQYDFMYGAVGIFPSEVACMEQSDVLSELRKLVNNYEKIVAIGEIGLDYHYEDTDKALQQKWFVSQMNLARELKVPVVIHSRDAAKDTVDFMREAHAEEIGGVIHCYSYTKETARDFLDMGFYFGIGGVVTFKNAKKLKAAVEYIPMDRIVLETDSPYLTPSPYRGERNSSAYLTYVAEQIAEIKGISVEEVYNVTWDNAHKMYRVQ